MVYIPPLFPWARARQKQAKQLLTLTMVQVRNPAFYHEGGVPDSVDGRFDLLSMFIALLMNRLTAEGREGAKLSQALFDEMFLNLELACREMGIGDLGVPRHMKRMMAGFNGRLTAYQSSDLHDVIKRNIFGTLNDVQESDVLNMINYIEMCKDDLNNKTYDQIIDQDFQWKEYKRLQNEIRQTA
jgi:cytochrome b pre-mRNA-processing protein 3